LKGCSWAAGKEDVQGLVLTAGASRARKTLPEHRGASTFSTAAEDSQTRKLSREQSGKDRARDPEGNEPSTLQTEWEATENSREQTRSWVTKTKERQIS